jgi:UDP-N-acetylmuramate dehydrogenase
VTATDNLARAVDEFDHSALSTRIERAYPLGAHTTYRVGGPADLFIRCDNARQLEEVARIVARSHIDVLVVGNGSNLLVADSGFRGLALTLGPGFDYITVDGVRFRAGGSTRLPIAARRTAATGLTGFEWAVGVPGTIGGAVRMNAGGHGSDMAGSLVACDVIDLRRAHRTTRPAGDLDLRYRHSNLAAHDVVIEAQFELAPGDPANSEREIDDIVRWRRENQPGGQNAGSVFTNPPADAAGRLIEAAGCKGLRIGSAHVSTKHANFFQVDDGGTAADVLALMREVRRRVHERTGIELAAETHLVGFAEGL